MTGSGRERLTSLGVTPESVSSCLVLAESHAGPVRLLDAAGGVADLPEVAAVLAEEAGGECVFFFSESGSWTVDEIAEVLLPATTLSSGGGSRHIVVGDVDSMKPAVADRLLKVIEEPGAGVVFWLLAIDAASVPATVRGRVSSSARVLSVAGESAVDLLVAEGLGVEEVREALSLLGGDPTLARLAVSGGYLSQARSVASTELFGCRSVRDADRFVADLCAISVGLKSGSALSGWSELSTAQRSRARVVLLRWFADGYELDSLRGPSGVARAQLRIRALEEFRRLVRLNVNPVHALAALVNASQFRSPH